ncbi:MAG: ChaN family lipoprotein, partial [Gammaproteobacteria bacterium]|nr:ChaN family lipoprotein [Gammaproteobacteria bacterium]
MKKITLGLLLSCSFSLPTLASDEIDKQCVPQGQWVASNGKHWSNSSLIKKLSQSQVVLIGEDHENPEHHRMQLHTIAQVYAEQPDLALGFEAFPRSVQKVLDKWVAGEIDAVHYTIRGVKKTGEIIHVSIYGSSLVHQER